MSSSSAALVVAEAATPNGAAVRAPEEDAELPVDLSQLPPIPLPKSLLLINNFVANTTRFLNHFAFECEDRISRVSSNLTRVEVMLAILEAKLNSIPDLSVTDAEVEAAGRSMAGGDTATPSATAVPVDIGISDQDLPSMDASASVLPPPPPPPPSGDGAMVALPPPPPPPESVNGDGQGAIVVAPPPPPPGMDDGDEDDGPMAPPDLPPPPAEAEPTFLKLKDDPVYAKYEEMLVAMTLSLATDRSCWLCSQVLHNAAAGHPGPSDRTQNLDGRHGHEHPDVRRPVCMLTLARSAH
jgi:hypothetical protein